jgi:hypothetical protein
MPAIGYPYSLFQGLSDFWTRFFADADQLEALYQGADVLIGQAYLDYLSTVLGIVLQDAIVFDKELYQMVLIREDQLAFIEGDVMADNRWSFALPAPIVSFASLDNQVVEPTASLEPNLDFEFSDGDVLFHVDPTNPTGNGMPLNGYARRAVDVAVGGQFTDSTVANWVTLNVYKGDTIRLLYVGTLGLQRKIADFPIVVVRPTALFVSSATSLPLPAAGVPYVILRVPFDSIVTGESFTLVSSTATFAHTRLDQGSVRVFAKGPLGADVVEGVDYSINYEAGIITQITTWQGLPGPYQVSYTWREEIYPASGPSPRLATTGVIVSSATTATVLQMAMWAPNSLVDRMTLANNFGALIGYSQPSSEAYRAFLQGIFQLYILGPVLDRLESALNVVMNLPVVHNDAETYQSTDLTDPLVDRILTTNIATNQTVYYAFPKGTPLRTDLNPGQLLTAFEVLTTAVTVTDYVQTPDWWYGQVIPTELFSPVDGVYPSYERRSAQPFYILHVADPEDGAQAGDPGLFCGADENGFIPPPGQPVYRHRLGFVLMDTYLKYHTFTVQFDAATLALITGIEFAQSLANLNNLVLSAKPAHTYVFVTPTTLFLDQIMVTEDDISFARLVGSRVYGPDEVIFTDATPTSGEGLWYSGDYFHYELWTAVTAFPSTGVPVTLANPPTAPRRRLLVRLYNPGTIGGVVLVENVDYTVDYVNCTVTRLTAWDATTVSLVYRQLNIGNLTHAPIPAGDMPLLAAGVDPALITAAYNPSAAGWDGVIEPPTAPRDMGMVERALIVAVS